ncbi:MAG: DUF1631 family protein [gamma proteobacterium symbiont of Taylorina sp.]|nr:DUF1631 family protein [gamma proteobacterium symbiont of Taylorina sp.]
MSHQIDTKNRLIFEKIKQSLLKDLSHSVEVFFPMAHDVLFNRADKAENNGEQIRFFDSISTLNNVKEPLKQKFIQLIENELENCDQTIFAEQKEQASDELDLIDLNDFEHWLAINQIVVKMSPHYEQELREIELRLGELLGSADKDNAIELGPFSPKIIFNCFSEATYEYFIGNDIILLLIHQFEKVMDNHFFELYKTINQIFIDNNILPVIEKKKLRVVKAPSASTQSNDADIPTLLAATSVNNTQSVSEQSPPTPSYPTYVDINSQHMSEIATLQNNVNLAPGYQTLKELFSFQSGQEYKQVSEEFYASDEYKQQLNMLVDELTLLQIEQSKAVSQGELSSVNLKLLVSLVQESLPKESYCIELHNEFQHGLDIIQRLFNFIEQEQWLEKPVKTLLSLLKLPLLKVSLLHKDFFESWSNPVRIVINKLAMLEFYNESNPFFQKVLLAINDILKNYQNDLAIFTNIQALLTQLLEMQSEYYDKKINLIIKNHDAQQAVSNELASRLAGKNVPVMIADFISHQWLPVLVACYLEKSSTSNQWSQYLQALDLLILTMTGDVSEDFIEHDVILFIIKQGLEYQHIYDKKILDDIEQFLNEGDDGNELNLDFEMIFKLLIGGYVLSDEAAVRSISKGMTDARSKANSSIASRLSAHDYVQYKKDGSVTKLQFIWKSDNQHLFVFAKPTAQEEIAFSLNEIVSMLDNGQLSQIKDYELPLLERSLYAIMGDVHDSIAQQTNIDQVTGLMVRNEFERVFRSYLDKENPAEVKCALGLINIDNFSLINNTCGFEAGDKYLSEIAELIRKTLSLDNNFSDTEVARYGTDEFILLLADQSEEEANILIEQLRQKIYNHHFLWEDKSFSLSGSIGLLVIPEIKDTRIFIKAVVTASEMAKEHGRNRVYILKNDDLELNHHQELQVWATRIDDMINNSQLDIRCQRLHPIDSETLIPHYEMLLLVKDEAGKTTPPAQFIEAAELYHKMVDVDRWVVESIFQWAYQHPELLEKLGGVAINLSGQSLNDVDFLEFIHSMFNQYPVPPKRICFEITETVAIINMAFAINVIHSIRELGCEFALDDFGTGQSSYAYLKNLPVDYLKIDGVFVKDMVNNPADRAMVKSINEIGHFLGMKTVAEFVENKEIMQVLKEIGVDYAQGYGVETPFLMRDFR